MEHLPIHFNHEELWQVIDEPVKFELIGFLLACLSNPNAKWFKTPQTRDNKRDGEGIQGRRKIFYEAKYISDYTKKKLSHKEVGSNINMAICELADALWIFTNGEVGLDLLNFVTNHNEIHKTILQKPLKLITVNRRQCAMLILKHQKETLNNELLKLRFVGYKSLTQKELLERKKQLVSLGFDLIEKIQITKQQAVNDFFYYPTLNGLAIKQWSTEDELSIIESLFQVQVYYDWSKNGNGEETINIPVGSTFYIIFKVSNFFFDKIDFSILLIPDGLLKFIGPIKNNGMSFSISSDVSGVSDKIISIATRIERKSFKKLDVQLSIGKSQFRVKAGAISVSNIFFLAPFIGEENNEFLALFKEKIDRTYYYRKFFLGLITGQAGVGKSRLIQEILDHCAKYNLRLFRSELVSTGGRKNLVKDMLSYFIGLDFESFVDINDQLITRFQEDKSFSFLFKNKEEFKSFKNTLLAIIEQGLEQVSNHEVKQVIEFIGKILYKYGQDYLVVLVIEDLHYGDKNLFYFLTNLYNNLKNQKVRVAFFLAARTEAKEISKAYEEFELLIENDPTYSITKIKIDNLSNADSLSLIKELVLTESKFERFIEQKILVKTGNNPFNIIHTLLHLKNKGIIIETNSDFEWRHIDQLENLSLHNEINHLLLDRFTYYIERTDSKFYIIYILQIIHLFESKVDENKLKEIWNIDYSLDEIILFLIQERILHKHGQFIHFDHENIFQFISENYMKDAHIAGEMMINWIREKGIELEWHELFVRSLDVCFEKYSSNFFASAFELFDKMLKKNNWKEILRYGNMIVKRSLEAETIQSERLYNVKFNIALIQSEYCGLEISIRSYAELELEINKLVKDPSLISNVELFNCYALRLKARLFRSDTLIMASNYFEARLILVELIKEINDFRNSSNIFSKDENLKELHAWALNRLGITYRPLGNIEKALSYMEESLELAIQIGHEYYIHHNYYDMAGCLIQMNSLHEAFELHKKCLTPTLNLPENLNAKVRSKIRTGVFETLLEQYEDAELELESAIIIARENNFLWELTRGLINQGCLYFKRNDYGSAYKSFKTCLHYVDIHESNAFKICLFNNLAFLNLHFYKDKNQLNYLKDSLGFMVEIVRLTDKKDKTNKPNNAYNLLGMLNMKYYQEYLATLDLPESIQELNHEVQKYSPTLYSNYQQDFIEMFMLKLSSGIQFYLMYMSFS
ncbi:MAG: tetratricopeptide repeat protein [Melioribacteraceae bacterium]